jgi:hypothetical protein
MTVLGFAGVGFMADRVTAARSPRHQLRKDQNPKSRFQRDGFAC